MAIWLSITFIFWFGVWAILVGKSGDIKCGHILAALILWAVTGGVPVLIFKLVG
ncbi:hypothetical protein F8538_06235 [Edwardsiella ictaluri]|uniref:hypothetical protein n=1 Tax=Edwardsiella ictaluri TaxID=67780 RepID=UPI0018DC1A48|nr:hypothetical protein [Edwardsiella ictaluri]QPW26474.1 hypothetical protein F8538_06235 [Edwardsiella ictaluri]